MAAARSKRRKSADPTVLERFSEKAMEWSGSSAAIVASGTVVVVWALSGPLFGFSETWQLVINTGTTIVTFLMVFLIQRAQNKDSRAVHIKLNEIVAALDGASNRLIDVESLSEAEIETLHRHFARLAAQAKADQKITESHSIEEAEDRHERKRAGREKQTRRAKSG